VQKKKKKIQMESKEMRNVVRKKLANISTIFFDMDNTLIATRTGDLKAIKKVILYNFNLTVHTF
jgi:predicted HAD superfamily phosphohydrolase YqeG